MRFSQSLAFTASVLLTFTNGLTINKRTDGPPRVLGLDIQRKSLVDPVVHDRLRKRAVGTVQVTLDNAETLYYANVTVGTPPQSIRLHIDTGSSDLWVNTPKSKLCSGNRNPCTQTGTYSANSSSTYAYVDSAFSITYADGTGAGGDYVTDTVRISSATLSAQQFGIGYTSSSDEGILGIGYELDEAQIGRSSSKVYSNLPASLVSQSLIQSNAYSLWLNDLDASTGSILFGGIDTTRFHGPLATLPIQQISGEFAEFLITLTALELGNTTLGSNLAIAVLLDSGTSLTYLPNSYVQAIFTAVGAQYSSSAGVAYVPCNLASSSTVLTFSFSGASISIPMSELVLNTGSQPEFPGGSGGTCLFGIAPAGDSSPVLGDTFLRSAYVVYDLANNEISIAPTIFNVNASPQILEIGSGKNSVPSAVPVSNPAAATGGSGNGGAAVTSIFGAGPTSVPGNKNAAGREGVRAGMLGLGVGAIMIFLAL